MTDRAAPLAGYGVFAAMLSAAGLPIYIHAPKVYVDEYGVGLTALAGVLFLLRLVDVVQDPLLGWLAQATRAVRGLAVSVAVAVLALSMVGLFAVSPPIAPLWWFALALAGLFSAFSFLTICFYAQGVNRAEAMGERGHLRLAALRETGALLGVCVASVAPVLLLATGAPFTGFALGFALLCALGWAMMRGEWAGGGRVAGETGFRAVLADRTARLLLLIALVNAAPVAVSSTLFLFFVESVLVAPGWEGPLLLLFFLAAAGAAPLWSLIAQRVGARRALMAAMVLSILSFSTVLTLGAGDTTAFALVCLASGAALGADLTLLPAMFARRMATIAPEAGAAFGLWSFVSKAALAVAAVTLLPALDAAGFVSGGQNGAAALQTLTWLYALVPCVLKLAALALLAAAKLEAPRAVRPATP